MTTLVLDSDGVKKALPHREPMLLIDGVLELERGRRVVAVKKTAAEDMFFKGHFPGRPIMPGTMIVEAMAQASILLYHSAYEGDLGDKVPEYYLGSIKARFLHGVLPGDELRIESETVKLIPTAAFVTAKAYVSGRQVAEADMVFAVKKI
jgi:3-hydroxyacyl-[acyl-carrier-protein] dehydratase